MNRKSVWIITILFIGLFVYGAHVTLQALTGKGLDQLAYFFPAQSSSMALSEGLCSSEPAIPGLEKTQDPQLKKLLEYQTVCGSYATDTLMVFSDMPKDNAGAKTLADSMAVTLKAFSSYQIHPIVIVEPVTAWGLVDFTEFESGFYNQWLTTYFQQLKADGITDAQIGTWVPFPEANLPYWNRANSTPADFGVIVSNYLTILKKYFPGAKGSILLSSATYATTDFDWSKGEYLSLLPYVKNIKPGLVDSFGLQGFPWLPVKGATGNGITNPAEYLNYKLAEEAANALQVKTIWFNTGTFGSKYTNNPDQTVFMPPETRKTILLNTLTEAGKLKSDGFTVSINLFAQDKSNTSEATNWSYWATAGTDSPDKIVLVDFLAAAGQKNIPVSLFDIMP